MLVAHPTRPAFDVSAVQLLGLGAGSITEWSALGHPPARISLTLGVRAGAFAAWFWLLTGTAPENVRVTEERRAVRTVEGDRNAVAIVSGSALGPGVRTATLAGVDPVLEPARYPIRVPGRPPGRVITAVAVGDILLSRTVHRVMAASGDFAAPFHDTWQLLAEADLAFANFEGTISERAKPRSGGTSFVAVPEGVQGLRKAGLDVLSLANNHTGDFGAAVLVETRERLEAAGIAVVGAGRNERAARSPAIVTRRGVRFGFLSFNAIIGTPPAGPDTPGAVRVRMAPWFRFSQADLDATLADVRALRRAADVVIVYPHWGTEYTNVPNADQQRVGRALVDAGADMVIATHPHWVQGAELYRGKLIAYSLGNFVFDQTWSRETQEAAAIQMVFWGRRLVRAEFVPVHIADAHRPRFVSWADGQAILARMWQGSGHPYRLAAVPATAVPPDPDDRR